MSNPEQRNRNTGFAPLEAVIALVIVAALVGIGVYVMQHHTAANTTTISTPTVSGGTSESIDQLTQSDAQAELQADKNADTQMQQDATSANSALSNVAGAYNETTL